MTMIACFDMGESGGAQAHGDDGDATIRARAPKSREHSRGAARGGSVGPVRIEAEDADGKFALGAPSVVPVTAPNPADHPAGRSNEEIRELFARKSRRREQGILEIMEQAKARGTSVERFIASIQYDSELAPKTTNRRQLLELGIDVPAGDSVPIDPAETAHVLWTVIYGLARLGIFLTGTNTYDDRALLEKLCACVLLDEVSDIPPSADLSEFIDLSPVCRNEQDPDGLMGPFEYQPQLEEDDAGSHRRKPEASAAIERDQLLPRPDRR